MWWVLYSLNLFLEVSLCPFLPLFLTFSPSIEEFSSSLALLLTVSITSLISFLFLLGKGGLDDLSAFDLSLDFFLSFLGGLSGLLSLDRSFRYSDI